MPFPHPSGTSRPSYWIASEPPRTPHPPVAEDLKADVVVVGAGIVGITTAYLVAKAGQSVVVVDRERPAMAETGHTTAHLQVVLDTRLSELVPRFGLEKTKLAWDSQAEAVRLIEEISREERIACDLERLDAYLFHAPRESGNATQRFERDVVEEEVRLARKMGYDAEVVRPDEIPFPAVAAARFPNQGRFHPRKYLLGVVEAAKRHGARFFEGTNVVDVKGGKTVRAETEDGHTLSGRWLVQATNVPFTTRGRMDTKQFPYRTYVIGARVKRREVRDALYWDTLDPYHYVRYAGGADGDLLLVGGEDHKVGTETDTDVHYENLKMWLRDAVVDFEVEHRWSGEVVETEDDLPYIGRVPGQGENELMASGDSGTGMTNGTIAALMLSERILGRGTPWDELYDPSRVTAERKAVGWWLRENAQAAKDLVAGMAKAEAPEVIPRLAPGEGAVVRKGMRQYAVARTDDGTLHCVAARCTHMGCSVAWNRSENSWDCPCHGSRFAPDGEVLHGPAATPLEVPEADELEALGLRPAAARRTE